MESYATNCQPGLRNAEDAAHLTPACKNGTDRVTPMRGYRCRECFVLFVEMRLAVNEAAAIAKQAEVLIHATKPSEHIYAWEQIRERWEDAHQKWELAAANLKNHFATTPRHAGLRGLVLVTP